MQIYRPVSILKSLSKVYEKCLFNQMVTQFDDVLSNYQYGFRKGFSSQLCLIVLVEKWKKIGDKGGSFAAIAIDLPNAFNSLISKLHAYGFDMDSLKLIYTCVYCMCGRKHRVKINDKYSSWENILFGVPQGAILGLLVFNIFIRDLFLFINDIDFAS